MEQTVFAMSHYEMITIGIFFLVSLVTILRRVTPQTVFLFISAIAFALEPVLMFISSSEIVVKIATYSQPIGFLILSLFACTALFQGKRGPKSGC
ncbi:hypothetical protein OAO18_06025 [Francisellaceae bacterium]|nr:hypothetical protein [Francisellaceae bacterium]